MQKASRDEGFEFAKVAFFGRDLDEYKAMFNLDLQSLKGLRLLDCPSGPAAFARQCAEKGITVVACDPLFKHADADVLRKIVEQDCENVARKQACDRAVFHAEVPSAAQRREAMELFLQDYCAGRSSQRYVLGQLPALPFSDQSFDMVVSGNFLFVYSDTNCGGIMENSPFDYDFHKKAIAELLRVCRKDVRIYPLRGPGAGEHVYLPPLINDFTVAGLRVALEPVTHRDIIGAEQMLTISGR